MVCAVLIFSFSTTSFKSLNVKAFFSQHSFSPSNLFISMENSVEVETSCHTMYGNPENITISRTSSLSYSNESLCKWRSVGRCCKNSSFVTENKSKNCSYQKWNKCINLDHYVLRPETMLWILLIITILFSSDGFLPPNDFQIIWLCNPLTISVLIKKSILETCLVHSIRYLPLYYLHMVQWFHQRTLKYFPNYWNKIK